MFSGCWLVYQVAQVCRLDGLLSTLCPRELSSRALNQIPYPLWIDSSCGIQGPQPGGTYFASSYLATPFLTTALILYTFLPSFVLFLLPPELHPPPSGPLLPQISLQAVPPGFLQVHLPFCLYPCTCNHMVTLTLREYRWCLLCGVLTVCLSFCGRHSG